MSENKKGCLFWGFIILAIMIAGCATVVGVTAWRMKVARDAYTDTKPLEVPVAQPSESERRRLAKQYETLTSAVERGIAQTFKLSADDLNSMIATVPDCKDARGRVSFAIDGDRLKATTSIPLGQLPMLQGRYLNGEIDLKIRLENGRLEVYPNAIRVKGEPIPESFMNGLRQQDFSNKLNSDPKVQEKLKHIERLSVEDGHLIIQTKGSK